MKVTTTSIDISHSVLLKDYKLLIEAIKLTGIEPEFIHTLQSNKNDRVLKGYADTILAEIAIDRSAYIGIADVGFCKESAKEAYSVFIYSDDDNKNIPSYLQSTTPFMTQLSIAYAALQTAKTLRMQGKTIIKIKPKETSVDIVYQ